VTGQLRNHDLIPCQGTEMFSKIPRSSTGSAQPPTQWVLGVLSPGLKWPGCKADHLPASNAKVKNKQNYTSNPYAFMLYSGTVLPLICIVTGKLKVKSI